MHKFLLLMIHIEVGYTSISLYNSKRHIKTVFLGDKIASYYTAPIQKPAVLQQWLRAQAPGPSAKPRCACASPWPWAGSLASDPPSALETYEQVRKTPVYQVFGAPT